MSSDYYRLLRALEVEATSPDGVITVTVGRNFQTRLRMPPRSFPDYRVRGLEYQLGTVTTTAFDTYLNARRDLRRAHHRDDDGAATELLWSRGVSHGGWARVTTHALSDWQFVLSGNIVTALPPGRFLDEAGDAIAAAVSAHNRQSVGLRAHRPGETTR